MFNRRSTKPVVKPSEPDKKEKEALEARKNSAESSLLGLFSQLFAKKAPSTDVISRAGSIDRNKYFG